MTARHDAVLMPDNEVHVWYDVLDRSQDAARRAAARPVMTDDEWDRCGRFRFLEGQRECLAARYLVRSVLTRYAPGVAPAEWRFRQNRWGRPEVAEPAWARCLRFNLSHADGVVACAISAHNDVGVDVERLGRRTPLQIADSHFARSEVADLEALPAVERPRRFLEYWTLKEAYIKARGAGLSLALDQFAFDLDRAEPTIAFEHGFGDDASHWQFTRLSIGSAHLVAVATRRAADKPVTVVARPFGGLAAHGPAAL
ncbi:MAG TPA: 4'-phosphopantetheinyl transferase superfamily protein [Vicinamibacterales bacterium]|nr:4'-phosphopantetheinyl transferase superfamily protein [Vicinamibacterales bacterium]